MPAWNGWYHCISGTYGSWLPGDPRGFRTRDHRVHIDGDYKSPPPDGKYDAWHEHARSIMPRDAVTLSPQARQAALAVMLNAWVHVHKIEVLALSIGGQHFHVLARFRKLSTEQVTPDEQKPTDSIRGLPIGSAGLRENDPARFYVGIAKKESAKVLSSLGLAPPGGVWAKRGKIVPIADREHQIRVMRYIIEHQQENAAVWDFKMALPSLPSLPQKQKPTD